MQNVNTLGPNEFVSTSTAAKMLASSVDRVYWLAKRGHLPALSFDGITGTLYRRSDVERCAIEHPRGSQGRRPKGRIY